MSDEWILTLGALVLLGIFLLSSTAFQNTNVDTMLQSEYVITGIALGQSVIDEAKKKTFDITQSPNGVSELSYPLGPEYPKSVPLPDTFNIYYNRFASDSVFKDVDDYNGYRRHVRTLRWGEFNISVSVVYADINAPDKPSTSGKSYCKKMTVTVTNKHIDSTKTKIILTRSFAFY